MKKLLIINPFHQVLVLKLDPEHAIPGNHLADKVSKHETNIFLSKLKTMNVPSFLVCSGIYSIIFGTDAIFL